MTNRGWMKVLCAVVACSAVFAGCKSRDVDDDGEGPIGGPTVIDDRQLTSRTAEGVRLTDVTFDNVQFDYNSFQVNSSEVEKVEKVASYLKDNSKVRLVTEGHCDERGSREYNEALGERRALAVRAYLIGLGIDGDKIQTKSFGEESPMDPEHTEDAWRLNRRVEFGLYKMD